MALRTQYVRRDPYADLNRQLNHQFEQVVGAFLAPRQIRRGGTPWAPVANVSSTDEAYSVDVEVPGLKRDEVTIELAEKTLTVSGRYGAATEQTAPEAEGSEAPDAGEATEVAKPARTLRTGSFEYRRTLPADVDRERVTAALANGVLSLVLPRVAKPAARRVEITEG